MKENCATCDYNKDGLCDRIGIFVNDEDQCNKWEIIKSRLTDLRS